MNQLKIYVSMLIMQGYLILCFRKTEGEADYVYIFFVLYYKNVLDFMSTISGYRIAIFLFSY